MKLYYALKQLMYDKYGEEKFSVACAIVLQWVNFKKPDHRKWTLEKLETICKTETGNNIPVTYEDGERLRILFNLKSVEQLFTN